MIARNGFWNSLLDEEGNADRLYNAEDLTFFYSKFFNSGILSNQGEMGDMFKVELTEGSYSVKINNGDCIINGKWYNGQGEEGVTLQMATTHTLANGYARTDAVCIKKNDETRTFEFYIKEGDVTSQNIIKPPSIDKNEELCLAYYQIKSTYSVQYATLVDTRDDDNFCGYATLKIAPASSNPDLDAYVNRYFYFCNGIDDNIQLSKMVQQYYLNEKSRNCEIKVIGKVGISGTAAGSGTESDPLCVFVLGKYNNTETNEDTTSNTNQVVVDFRDCPSFSFTENKAGYSVLMFGGTSNFIKHANCSISSDVTAATARMFLGNYNKIEDCYFSVSTKAGIAKIFEGNGIINRCTLIATTESGEAYAIILQNIKKILRVTNSKIWGRYTSSGSSYGVFIPSNYTNAWLVMSNNSIDGNIGSSVSIYCTNTFKLNSGTYIVYANFVRQAGLAHDESNVFNNVVITNSVSSLDDNPRF